MNDVDTIREGLWWMEEHMLGVDREMAQAADEAVARVESALREMTRDHGTQCQCAGCSVLRDGRDE